MAVDAVDIRPPLPRRLQVEVTGSCNLACRMCLVRYRPKLGRRQGAMCLHTFRAIVDDLPGLERLTLQGLGEPLLAPDLFEMIAHAAARGIKVGFNTNGTFLTRERMHQLLDAGLHWLHISIDGATAETYESIRDGSSFELVTANVAAAARTMRERGAVLPSLSIVFVAMRRNIAELPALVRLAAELGVPRLWVQNLSHSFGDTDPAGGYRGIRDFAAAEALWAGSDPHVEELFQAAREVAGRRGVELRLPRLVEAEVSRAEGEPACHWPFESAYVTYDGKVQPCCMVMGSDRVSLGSAEELGFDRVWDGPAYRSFRSALLGPEPPAVCVGCSLYRRLF